MLFIDSLFNSNELIEQSKLIYPFNLLPISEALETKLETDPEFEVWSNLLYYHQSAPGVSTNHISPYKYLVSNKGRVVNLRDAEDPKYLEETMVDNKIPTVTFTYKKKVEVIEVARAVACSFVPIPDAIGTYLPRDLTVIHKDSDTTNVSANNLEWKLP